jgi:hypothetical protein
MARVETVQATSMAARLLLQTLVPMPLQQQQLLLLRLLQFQLLPPLLLLSQLMLLRQMLVLKLLPQSLHLLPWQSLHWTFLAQWEHLRQYLMMDLPRLLLLLQFLLPLLPLFLSGLQDVRVSE